MIKCNSWGFYHKRPDLMYEIRLKEGHRAICALRNFSVYCLEGILMIDQPKSTSMTWLHKGADSFFFQDFGPSRIWALMDARLLVMPIGEHNEDDIFPAGGPTPENEHKAALALYAEKYCTARVLDMDQVPVISTALKLRKQVIGFCNGCFDIFHAGHVELLMQAKSRCDALFVAVNTDESVMSLKGPNRPIIRLAERVKVLSAIRYVDYVIPNADKTCLPALEAADPDIYVTTEEKGKSGPEAQKMIKSGKPVEVIPLISVFHSSEIAQKMKSF